MLTLRRATVDDAPLLRRWDEEPHVMASDPTSDWQWETELAEDWPWRDQLVAEVHGVPIGFLQIIDRSGLWPAISGGCHPARDTTEAIVQAGFDIEEIERFGFAAQRFEPQIPHILGRARAA